MRIALLCCALMLLGTSLHAQYYNWGRSPSSLRWQQIEGPGGKIVFPDYYRLKADQVALYMDTIRPSITYGFKNPPLRLPTVLHTQNFQANGLVLWAPKRMELEAIPSVMPYADPWLKQLVSHESRHAVQYGNLYCGFMRPVSYLLGQQAGLISSILLPIWFLEGDATMAETQMSEFGRALQPSFTIEYRAYLDGAGVDQFVPDQWFCGSYKNFMPNHYQLGYQLTAWARERYGDDMWGRVTDYVARNPYVILTTKFSLGHLYKTSSTKIFRNTFAELKAFWDSIPKQENSARLLQTPITSYTTYSNPMAVSDSLVIAFKKDLDRTNRLVAVDPRTEREQRLCYVGAVSTPPSLHDSTIYWTEYRSSLLWEQQVFSRICTYDLRTGRKRVINTRKNALYPTVLPSGELLSVGYDYVGRYYLERADGTQHRFPDSLSVHGLAYDPQQNTLAFIGLSDAGMWLGAINPDGGEITPLAPPSRVSIYNLTAAAGQLAYNSIESGRDEVHLFDLATQSESRLSTSRYGSFAPSNPVRSGEKIYFTTYTKEGYRLAEQTVDTARLTAVPYRRLPQNVVNPPRRKWPVVNLDAVETPQEIDTTRRVKRYRKATHLFNPHSWAPFSFSPFHIVQEDLINFTAGATLMSQDLLSSTFAYLSYGWTGEGGSRVRGSIGYYGLAPKFDVSVDYGGRDQLVYMDRATPSVVIPKRSPYFSVAAQVSLPMTLSSGRNIRTLTPTVELQHLNALLYDYKQEKYKSGYRRLVAGVSFLDHVRMAPRDLQPRWGYAARVSFVGAPFHNDFGSVWAAMGRVYLPGIGAHHAVSVRGAIQFERLDSYNFFYKEVFPRGATYNFISEGYRSVSLDYQMPLWYPDGGINSVVYFKRIRLGVYGDYANFHAFAHKGTRFLTSYGGELFVDMHIGRIPVNATTLSFYVYKPNDRTGVVTGFNVGLPF